MQITSETKVNGLAQGHNHGSLEEMGSEHTTFQSSNLKPNTTELANMSAT